MSKLETIFLLRHPYREKFVVVVDVVVVDVGVADATLYDDVIDSVVVIRRYCS